MGRPSGGECMHGLPVSGIGYKETLFNLQGEDKWTKRSFQWKNCKTRIVVQAGSINSYLSIGTLWVNRKCLSP